MWTPLRSHGWRGAHVVAVSLPLLFVHARYAPAVTVEVAGADVDVGLADLAVAAVVATAAVTWRRSGAGELRGARALWIALAALCSLAVASAAWGRLITDGYPLEVGLVSALKFLEYALLAPATALLLRERRDVSLVLWSLTVLAGAAAVGGLLQFVGLVGDLDDTPPWRRKPSFVGYHDFAALAAAVLVVGCAALSRRSIPPSSRSATRLGVASAATGAVGLALAGSVAAAGGAVAAAVLVVLLLRRRGELRPRGAAAAGAVLGAAVVATLVIRSGDVADFARFLGVEQRDRNSQIESYSQRTVLTYIGGRIALDHPLTGTGWQGSSESASFRPYLADARTRFPDVAREALPSETRRWGVQNAYVQAAADMGVAGLAALVAVLSAAAWLGVRGWLRGADGAALGAAGIVVVVAAELAALALVPGVPVWALLWLAAGVAVASPAVSREPA